MTSVAVVGLAVASLQVTETVVGVSIAGTDWLDDPVTEGRAGTAGHCVDHATPLVQRRVARSTPTRVHGHVTYCNNQHNFANISDRA